MSDTTTDPFDLLRRNIARSDSADVETHPDFDRFEELVACRRLAHNERPSAQPVLAAFDVQTAAIWGNEALASAIHQNRKMSRKLKDEDVETLVHEFARALEYEDIFKEKASHTERVAAMTRRLGLQITRATEESYMNQMLTRERSAEEWAQRVQLEILSGFDQSQKGTGLRDSAIVEQAEGLAKQWVSRLKDDYLSKARREYRRLVDSRSVSAEAGDVLAGLRSDPTLMLLPIGNCARMFPIDLSQTLSNLVDAMTTYRISFIVPAPPENDANPVPGGH